MTYLYRLLIKKRNGFSPSLSSPSIWLNTFATKIARSSSSSKGSFHRSNTRTEAILEILSFLSIRWCKQWCGSALILCVSGSTKFDECGFSPDPGNEIARLITHLSKVEKFFSSLNLHLNLRDLLLFLGSDSLIFPTKKTHTILLVKPCFFLQSIPLDPWTKMNAYPTASWSQSLDISDP